MATSLAQQLSKLAVPQSSVVQRKKRVSLLFPLEEVEKYDRETLYNIAKDGLSLLQTFDPKYHNFEILFNEESINFQRAIKDNKTNEELNAKIYEFLLLVSPHIFLRPAQQAVEWLIQRFSVNEYNQDELMACFLPHCESPIFVQVVCMMELQTGFWSWLKPIQTSKYVLTRKSLADQCVQNPSLLSFITKLTHDMLEVHGSIPKEAERLFILANYDALTSASAVKDKEKVVALIVDQLQKHLDSPIDQLRNSSLFLAVSLAKTTELMPSTVSLLVHKIIKGTKHSRLFKESIAALAFICKTQNYGRIKSKDFKALMKRTSLLAALQMAESYFPSQRLSLTPFLNPFLDHLVPSALDDQNHASFLESLVDNFTMDKLALKCIIRNLICATNTDSPDHLNVASNIMKKLETRFSVDVDALLQEEIKHCEREKIDKIISSRLSKYQQCGDGLLLFEALTHNDVEVRLIAAKKLKKDAALQEKDDFVSSSILLLLNDPAPQVVNSILEFGKDLWVRVIDREKLLDTLSSLLSKSRKSTVDKKEWLEVEKKILQVLCYGPESDNILSLLSSFLLIPSKQQADFAEIIQCHLHHPYFKNIFKPTTKNDLKIDLIKPNIDMLKALVSNLNAASEEDRLRWVKANLSCTDYTACLIVLLVAADLEGTSHLEAALQMCSHALEIKKPLSTVAPPTSLSSSCTEILKASFQSLYSKEMPEIAVCYCLRAILHKLPSLIGQNLDHPILMNIFDLLLSRQEIRTPLKKIYGNLMVDFLNFSLGGSAITFLISMGSHRSEYSLQLHAKALVLASFLLDSTSECSNDIIPALLVTLATSRPLAKPVFACIKAARQLEPYTTLCRMLIKKESEILVDANFVKEVAQSWASQYPEKAEVLLNYIKNPKELSNFRYGLALLLERVSTPEIVAALFPLLGEQSLPLELGNLILKKLGPHVAHLFTLESSFFAHLAATLKHPLYSVASLAALTPEYFAALPQNEVKVKLLQLLLEMNLEQKDNHLTKQTLINLFFDARVLVPILSQGLPPKPDSFIDLDSTTEGNHVIPDHVLLALEILQTTKNVSHKEALTPVLFELLKECLKSSSIPEYVQQLILGCLEHCTGEECSAAFQIELIVTTLQQASMRLTQHLALHMLTQVAHRYQKEILCNMLTIFSFMGRNLSRQDSDYSFDLMLRSIDTLIPSLLPPGCSREQKQQVGATILRLFVDCLSDIPSLRRALLYPALFNHLGSLFWVFIVQVLSSKEHFKPDEQGNLKPSDDIVYVASLLNSFKLKLQIKICSTLFEFTKALRIFLDKQEERDNIVIQEEILDTKNLSNKHLQDFSFQMVAFLELHLSSQEFASLVASTGHDGEASDKIIELISEFLEHLLLFLYKLPHYGEFGVQLQKALFRVVEAVNALLPTTQFLAVIKALLKSKNEPSQCHALQMLTSHLICSSPKKAVLVLPLTKHVLKLSKKAGTGDLAMDALVHLCKFFSHQDHMAQATSVVSAMVEILADPQSPLVSKALICLAEITQALQVHTMPLIPAFLDWVMELFKSERSELLSPLINVLHKMVTYLGPVLTTYLEEITTRVVLLSCDVKTKKIKEVAEIQEGIIQSLSLDRLVSTLATCFEHVVMWGKGEGVAIIANMLSSVLSQKAPEQLTSTNDELCQFFLSALEFREIHAPRLQLTAQQISYIESALLDACVAWMLRVQSGLKEYIQHIKGWADSFGRKLTFYLLNSKMVEKFSSLYKPYATLVMKDAALFLEEAAKQEDDLTISTWVEGVVTILDLTRAVLKLGDEWARDKKWFGLIKQAALAHLTWLAGDYRSRVEQHLAPCIAQILQTLDIAGWAAFNKEILALSRHPSAKVRWASLACVRAMVQTVGHDYLTLLPDTEPMLAERVEDECPEVEAFCHELMGFMEQTLEQPMLADL